ncbi:MAG: hypothetical protein AB2A00_08145 [Myxococcota bacterium]
MTTRIRTGVTTGLLWLACIIPAAAQPAPTPAPADAAPAPQAAPPPVASGEPTVAERVVWWPLAVEGTPPELANEVGNTLRVQLETALGPRLVSNSDVDAARQEAGPECANQNRCLADAGRKLQAGRVLAGTLRTVGTETGLELRLVDVEAVRELGRVSGLLSANSRQRELELREVVVRLATPEKHVGTLVLNAYEPTAEVTVDGQRQSVSSGTTSLRVPLRVGKHNLEVTRGGKPVMTEVLDIRFEEIMVLQIPPPGTSLVSTSSNQPQPYITDDGRVATPDKKSSPLRVPTWLGPVVALGFLPPLLVGSLFFADVAFAGPMAVMSPQTCEANFVSSATTSPPMPNTNILNVCGLGWRYAAKEEQHVGPAMGGDLVVAGVFALLSLAALGLGGALFAASFAPPLEELDARTSDKPAATRMTVTREQK